MPDQQRIRPARDAGDWDAVRTLARAYEREIGVDLCFQDFEGELAALPGRYAQPGGGAWIAFRGETPVGLVALRPLDGAGGPDCEMKRLYVSPEARGTGLGRRLAERCVHEARARGYTTMWLDTLRSMDAANALYDALGFVDTDPYYENPLPDIRYRKMRL